LVMFWGSEMPVLGVGNKAIGLEYSNMADGIRQEIELEINFGEVLWE
jgi:hypothetical protein